MTEIEDQYLGDGVYASFDGFHIILDLRAQGSDRIALEPTVVKKFKRYAERVEVAVEERHREQQVELERLEREEEAT